MLACRLWRWKITISEEGGLDMLDLVSVVDA